MVDLLQNGFVDSFGAGFLAGALIASTVYLIRGIVALFQRILRS